MSESTGGGAQPPDPDQSQNQDQNPPYPGSGQQPGQQHPAYGQVPNGAVAPTEPNVSAIILTIVSALSLGSCIVGIPSLIFGIMALTSNRSDPVGSRQKARTGWIIYAVNVAVAVVLLVIFAVFFSGIFLMLLNNVPAPSVTSVP